MTRERMQRTLEEYHRLSSVYVEADRSAEYGYVIRTDGTVSKVVPAEGCQFGLKEMQDIVGGNIEVLTMYDNVVIVCNEEGRLMNLPVNSAASFLTLNTIVFVGDVLVCNTAMLG